MSATELIKEVAALSPEERALFDKLLQKLNAPTQPPNTQERWPDFAKRLKEIYGDQTIPDSQKIISEGRGEY